MWRAGEASGHGRAIARGGRRRALHQGRSCQGRERAPRGHWHRHGGCGGAAARPLPLAALEAAAAAGPPMARATTAAAATAVASSAAATIAAAASAATVHSVARLVIAAALVATADAFRL